MAKVQVRVIHNRFPDLPGKMRGGAVRRVRAAGERVRKGAQTRSRVRTGEMAAGWTVSNGDLSVTVSNAVPHTIFNEFGTRKMSAQPMLGPAIDAEASAFGASFSDIEAELG